MKYLAILLLAGCQITVARLPSPIDADVAAALQQHAQMLDVLAKDYQERKKGEVNK